MRDGLEPDSAYQREADLLYRPQSLDNSGCLFTNSDAHVLPSGLTAGAFRVGGAENLIRSILNKMSPIGACDLLYKVM